MDPVELDVLEPDLIRTSPVDEIELGPVAISTAPDPWAPAISESDPPEPLPIVTFPPEVVGLSPARAEIEPPLAPEPDERLIEPPSSFEDVELLPT